MYKHLQLFNLNGLKECSLSGLGQINVICGKNNSGKSTLLDAITKTEYRREGRVLNIDDAGKIFNSTKERMGWQGQDSTRNTEYRNTIRQLIDQPKIWFSNDADTFAGELEKQFRRNGMIANYAYNRMSVVNAFNSLFGINKATVLIPPKRKLELAKQIQGSESIFPSGEGILNSLFLARNQQDGSAEKKLYQELGNAFNKISGGYSFDVFMDRQNTAILYFSNAGQSWIPAGACGLGLQDLLVMIWFSLDSNYQIILIEEPESHIHPDMQRRLLSFFKEHDDKQYFLTAHSNIFVNNAYVDKVFFTHFEDSIKVDDATSRASILNDIGYDVTDNLVSDLVILVEGPKDTPFVEEFLIKFGLPDKYNIKIWPLGGDIMDQLDLSVLAQQYKLIALVDKDPASKTIRRRFMANCKELGIPVHQTQRYAIENYFSLKVIREVFENQVDEAIVVLDPKIKLEDQDVSEAARIMAENQIQRLVVLSRDDKRLVGVVSLGDLARSETTDLSGRVLQRVSEPDTSEPTKSA